MSYLDNVPARCMLVDAPALDPIISVWLNDGGGKGRVILQCYGDTWTAYWGAMGLRTLEQFFVDCDVEYLTARFGPKRKDEAYLKRIVTAVRESIIASRIEGNPGAVKCHCVGNFGPNPECGQCGGDGTYETTAKGERDGCE